MASQVRPRRDEVRTGGRSVTVCWERRKVDTIGTAYFTLWSSPAVGQRKHFSSARGEPPWPGCSGEGGLQYRKKPYVPPDPLRVPVQFPERAQPRGQSGGPALLAPAGIQQ